ncbi:UPF0176 protein [Thermoactinomyces sp. DSM 45892]|nr:rhodanese-related sulfurtransferase [Thermoactinomyces sp. DSM 45892]SDY52591.1 UPF0176 protein [Thermoactinomyces sp. DSM 45892]
MSDINTEKPYLVILYYQYVPIESPEQFSKEHLHFCKRIHLKGRILVSYEGINGTVSGTQENIERYMEYMKSHPLFKNIQFKVDVHNGHAFKKMHVRPRKELVAWNLDPEIDVDPNQLTGKHVSPKEFHQLLQQDDVIIIDGRNDYEYDLGHFRGAIRPDLQTTREFPKWVRENLHEFKDKKILTYCTGGIRCEKLSGFLLKEGFQDVVQLDGGIVTYGKDPEVQGDLFEGSCYVFDDRISVPINRVHPTTITTCHHCGTKSDQYINCRNTSCDQRHIVCPQCLEEHQGYCSTNCKEQK